MNVLFLFGITRTVFFIRNFMLVFCGYKRINLLEISIIFWVSHEASLMRKSLRVHEFFVLSRLIYMNEIIWKFLNFVLNRNKRVPIGDNYDHYLQSVHCTFFELFCDTFSKVTTSFLKIKFPECSRFFQTHFENFPVDFPSVKPPPSTLLNYFTSITTSTSSPDHFIRANSEPCL